VGKVVQVTRTLEDIEVVERWGHFTANIIMITRVNVENILVSIYVHSWSILV
jgi:UDP-N-acetylmuramyl tripeptide synthase